MRDESDSRERMGRAERALQRAGLAAGLGLDRFQYVHVLGGRPFALVAAMVKLSTPAQIRMAFCPVVFGRPVLREGKVVLCGRWVEIRHPRRAQVAVSTTGQLRTQALVPTVLTVTTGPMSRL